MDVLTAYKSDVQTAAQGNITYFAYIVATILYVDDYTYAHFDSIQ